MKPTEDAKMGNDEAERLIAAISSQIGDDVSVIFNHESLFKRSRDLLRTQAARIAELEARVTQQSGFMAAWKDDLTAMALDAKDQSARAEAAEAEVARLREAIRHAHDTLYELNPCNYDHDEVCRLNDASVEVILALAPLLGEAHGETPEWWADRAALQPKKEDV